LKLRPWVADPHCGAGVVLNREFPRTHSYVHALKSRECWKWAYGGGGGGGEAAMARCLLAKGAAMNTNEANDRRRFYKEMMSWARQQWAPAGVAGPLP
jgi:hypothetical protein